MHPAIVLAPPLHPPRPHPASSMPSVPSQRWIEVGLASLYHINTRITAASCPLHSSIHVAAIFLTGVGVNCWSRLWSGQSNLTPGRIVAALVSFSCIPPGANMHSRLICGSLGPYNSALQTASRSVQSFLQGSTHTDMDHGKCDTDACMRCNNSHWKHFSPRDRGTKIHKKSINFYGTITHLPLATCLVIPRVHDATGHATGWTTSCIDIRSFTVTSSHDCCSVRLLSLRFQSRISSTYSLNDILGFLKRYFQFRNFDVFIAVSNVHGTTVARTMT